MDTHFRISGGDEDVSMIALGEEFVKADGWVICIVKKKQPFLAVSREPVKSITSSIANLFTLGNNLESSGDSSYGAGINEENLPKP